MKLSELYQKAVEVGMRYDPRDGGAPAADLERIKRIYDSLTPDEQKWFDNDALWNPYLDSRPVCGDEDGKDPEVSKVMAIIDSPPYGVIEICRREGINLVISHHPEGRASAGLHQVLDMQIGIWKKHGVRIEPVDEYARDTSLKYLYAVAQRESREDNLSEITEEIADVLRYFGLPWIALHTVADNCATTYLQKKMDQTRPDTLQDVVDLLMTIEEYQRGTIELIGPRIVTGRPKNKTGKIVVDMTGGGEAPKEIFSSFADSGIRTIICMHTSKDWYDSAAKHQVQIVCAGHAPSDILAMNLLFDEVLPEHVEVYPKMGGYRRFSHKQENWQVV
jgi:putative NIF3 family GTP cyclohydrolase 1 type 2